MTSRSSDDPTADAGSPLAYRGLGLACGVLRYLIAITYSIHVEEAVLHGAFGPACA